MNIKIISIIFFKLLGGLSFVLLSNTALACPAPSPQPQFSGICTDIKTISEFTGSAAQMVSGIEDDIETSGDNIVDALENSASAQIKVISDSANSIIKTLTALQSSETQDSMTRQRLLHEAKMDYLMELESREMQARNSPMGMNDTPEELDYIIGILEDNLDTPVPLIYATVQEEIDTQNPAIPVKIHSARGVCDDDDDSCSIMQEITPGNTMEQYFYECSREKQEIRRQFVQQSVASSVNENVSASQSRAVRTQNSGQATANRLVEQGQISCSPEAYSAGHCNNEMSQEEYVRSIRENRIIINGNISASNFYSPSMMGSANPQNISSLNPEQRRLVERNNIIFDGTENQNTPPLIYTFKNSNQYLSALDFADNLVNENLVANQSVEEQGDLNNSNFQALYLSRMAGLSLSRFSLNRNISDRLGQNVSEERAMNGLDRENPVREKASGAGNLDQLIFSVERESQNLGNLDAVNQKHVLIKMLESQNLQNKLLLEEILRNERIELLMASILANQYNSPEFTEHLNRVRGN